MDNAEKQTDDALEKLGEALSGMLAAIALLVAHVVLWGYVGAYLWTWFAVPLGAPPLAPAHVVGLLLIVGLARGAFRYRSKAERNTDPDIGGSVAYAIGAPLLVWLVGYVAKGFM